MNIDNKGVSLKYLMICYSTKTTTNNIKINKLLCHSVNLATITKANKMKI